MRLGMQVWLVRYGCYAAAIALFVWLTQHQASVFAVIVPIALLLYAGSQPQQRLAPRAIRRMMELSVAERFDEAEQLLGEIEEVYPRQPQHLALFQLYRATILLGRGRAADAVKMLDTVKPDALTKEYRAWWLNNLAWSLVESGQADRAVPLARESAGDVDAPDTVADDARPLRGFQLGTLGAALVLGGSPDEAIPLLERSLAFGGRPGTQAARHYYLGKAALALGRHDEAAKAWSTAAALTPASRFTRASSQALGALAPGPYRGG